MLHRRRALEEFPNSVEDFLDSVEELILSAKHMVEEYCHRFKYI